MNLFWIISTIATMNRIQHHTTIHAFYSNNIDKGRKIKIVRLLMCIPATFIKNIIEFNQIIAQCAWLYGLIFNWNWRIPPETNHECIE